MPQLERQRRDSLEINVVVGEEDHSRFRASSGGMPPSDLRIGFA